MSLDFPYRENLSYLDFPINTGAAIADAASNEQTIGDEILILMEEIDIRKRFDLIDEFEVLVPLARAARLWQ